MLGQDSFDSYNLRARIYPGLLTVLPVAIVAVPLIGSTLPAVWTPIFVTSGALFLIVQLVRTVGLRAERQLTARWNGLPTTHLLRFSEADSLPVLQRRRAKLETIYGQPLPSRAEEEADSTAADKVYEAATRSLIARVTSEHERFPRVNDENINYGFRRNMLGMRPIAVTLTILSLLADAAIAHFSIVTSQQLFATIAIHGIILIMWLLLVRPQWVREVADRYASRLFDALDVLVPSVAPPTS